MSDVASVKVWLTRAAEQFRAAGRSAEASLIEAGVESIEALEAEAEKLKKLDTYEVGYRDGESSGAADITILLEEYEEEIVRLQSIVTAQDEEIHRLMTPKPPGYEHLSHETIDAIRATSTKPKD